MDDATRDIADLESNMWSFFAVLGAGEGGEVLDTPTRLVTRAPIKQPPYNGVWRFLDDGTAPIDTQMDALIDEFTDRGVAPIWILHPSTPAEVRSLLIERGWDTEQLYGMARSLRSIHSPPPTPPGVEISEVSRDDEEAWLHLVTWRYGLDTTTAPYLRDMYRCAIGAHTRMWVARIDGRPVSKVALHVSAGVAGIYAVATTEEARGKGLAAILTLVALNDAARAGIDRSVLHSTPMARGLYAKLGFRDVVGFEVWSMPGTLHL